MHIKIAICDDDIKIQFAMEDYLKQIENEYGIECDIECFDKGDMICENYEKGKFDLIFLDIEYKGKNGVEVGKHIKNLHGVQHFQQGSKILFLHRGFIMQIGD